MSWFFADVFKGIIFSWSWDFFRKCIKEMKNFGEEKEVIISCKWTLKHCHWCCHFITGFAYCRLLHLPFFFCLWSCIQKFVPTLVDKYGYFHHHLCHADNWRSLFLQNAVNQSKDTLFCYWLLSKCSDLDVDFMAVLNLGLVLGMA